MDSVSIAERTLTRAQDTLVLRLTLRECGHLQGFLDDYTRIAWHGKLADQCPDSSDL